MGELETTSLLELGWLFTFSYRQMGYRVSSNTTSKPIQQPLSEHKTGLVDTFEDQQPEDSRAHPWHSSQMFVPLPHPTDSGEKIWDRAGVLEAALKSPRVSLQGTNQHHGQQGWRWQLRTACAANQHVLQVLRQTGSTDPASKKQHRDDRTLSSRGLLALS